MSSLSTADQKLCRRFTLADIQSATRNFSDTRLIGNGGFGKVYKALIDNGSVTVAIKRLSSNSNQGEKEFATEMETLTKFRHHNLVSLIGYCNEEGEMILVYDYMVNGTLADHLYKLSVNGPSLSWNQRLKICIGAGRGLDYLHSGCNIIHRDVKSTNILLDDKFTAKVSDFGLAKRMRADDLESHVSTNVKGTFGYIDPSYFTSGRLTKASDTYAFGVVLLEVLSGKPAVGGNVAESEMCMSMWALEKIRNGKAEQIVTPCLRGEISESCLKTFVGVAKRCLHNDPKKRATMTRAVALLELALEQQERKRAAATYRLQIWPFWSRFGSTQKDEQEAIDKEASALRVDHIINGLPIYVPTFPVAELEDITHCFSGEYLVAQGSKGELIFRGVLKSGRDATIKLFYKKSHEDDRLFMQQVSTVSNLKHENMVQLLGYCLDSLLRALVYELAPHGSLDVILHGLEAGPVLSWAQRIKTAAGAARGLCYIHDCGLIHRDIKSRNVLLFDDGIAKITHPHLSKRCCCEASSFGYEEPFTTSFPSSPTYHDSECAWANLTVKGDVYSFGLVLLELLTGTELFDCPRQVQQDLVSWAKPKLSPYMVHEIVDARFKADYPVKAVEKMAAIAKLCLHYDAPSRPNMSTVVEALQIAVQETREYYSPR